ncbi:MAG TPA: 1-deoxy-D-xylulose-5-phosphate synthase [bacterium]|nr:1-deoxy-D-xylulose-5-phosphate synthase [bacterium]
MKLIDRLSDDPSLIKKLSLDEMAALCEEIRLIIIDTVSVNGGHLSSNLGAVELTLSLHRIFNIPYDKIIWDVGHQCYTHKLLTGRYPYFKTLRKEKGISGFPAPEESEADIFKTGHAGTAVSSATGLKTGQSFLGDNSKVIAVIGDGSLTNGVTFEGLNFLGVLSKNLLVILNDNKMSISSTKGALSYYLAKLITSPVVNKPKEDFAEMVKSIPSIGEDIVRLAHEVERKTKYLFIPGVFFEKMGMRYFGPIDGHDIKQLLDILSNIRNIKEPVLLHVVTKKGKGYKPAEKEPAAFHSAGPFEKETGRFIKSPSLSPGTVVGKALEEIAEKEEKLVVLTAAMEKGLGLEGFASRFPERFYDVGIAESHCILFASGLAKAGMKVVVAIYSTFLQRGYDQLFHDICLQNLPVIFLVDRAGIVGEDGPTHHGIFDISFLRVVPNLKIFAPYSIENLKETLIAALQDKTPVFIRFPKESLPPSISPEEKPGKTVVLGCGSMASNSLEACRILMEEKHPVSFYPVSAVKPLETGLLKIVERSDMIITVEENTVNGGFGSAVCEYISDKKLNGRLLRIGLPDSFIEQGKRDSLLNKYGLSPERIAERIKEFMND